MYSVIIIYIIKIVTYIEQTFDKNVYINVLPQQIQSSVYVRNTDREITKINTF